MRKKVTLKKSLIIFLFVLNTSFAKEKVLSLPPLATIENKKQEVATSSKVKIFYFGFTKCLAICPFTLKKLATFLKKNHLDTKVDVIFLSLDVDRDTGASAYTYARKIGDNFYGYALDKNNIKAVTKEFNVFYNKQKLEGSEFDYTIDHSNYFYLVKNNSLLRVHRAVTIDSGLLKKIEGLL